MHVSDMKMERVGALKNGRGIQHLLTALYEILGNPISMFNTEYTLQAYTPVATDDSIWNELVVHGNFSYETQLLFKEEGFIDAVANTESLAYLISDRVKYDRILGKLYNENKVHVANLVIVSSNKPFEEDDASVFEAACKVCSKEIIKSQFYQTYGKMYQETYIRKLIDGEIEDKCLYAAHIAIVYNGFKSSMRLVVADIVQCDPERTKLAYFRDLFGHLENTFEYAIYANYILIIIQAERNLWFSPKKALRKLYKLFVQHNIYAGVSCWFDNIYALRERYIEAVTALESGLKSGGAQRFFQYECEEAE